ncbi:MAG: enoyl-CoA hydratase/isomerase family protein [Nocardioidaceae bacterium]|nr:enoyl-CoA hydratase/isomerase family protein [Nocardioidaceae bacterium]MDQ3326125.1 enoyl-CoA hydratase-related protein [Actinomycetota bacterium]
MTDLTTTPEPVGYADADGIATITLQRPEAMNSLDGATKDALRAAVERAAADDATRAVLLTGTGRAFCVGQDLREHVTALRDRPLEQVWATVEEHYAPIATALVSMPKPVVAAVNGVAAGAGASLAFACDLRVVADTASFNTAFAGIGLSCDTGASWTLPRLVGRARALDLLYRPRNVDAAEAERLGIASMVVPADRLLEEARELTRALAAGPTLAYAGIRASVEYAATHTLAESLAFEATQMARTGSSEDHRDAVDAFVAKKPTRFHGR